MQAPGDEKIWDVFERNLDGGTRNIFIEIHEMQNEGEQKFKAHKQCDHVLD